MFHGEIQISPLDFLEHSLWRFAAAILDVAVRLHGVEVEEATAQEKNLAYLEPERVRASLERDLDAFWPGRKWDAERQPLMVPTLESAKDPGPFVDYQGLELTDLGEATGPAVDWAQFGISVSETEVDNSADN